MRPIWLLLVLAACPKKEDEELPARGDCDPLDESLCALPFPSAFYLDADAETVTGYRVAFAEESLPINRDGGPLLPKYWNEKDGFSIFSPALTYFDDVSIAGVIGHQDLAAHLADDAKTVIWDVDDQERVPHFVEVDSTADSADASLLILRPVVPLDFDHTYVVGIRGLEKNAGGSVDVSAGFLALRDGDESADPDVERQRETFDGTVFPELTKTGFPRGDLQLAWSFHTSSRESTVGRASWVMQDAEERMASGELSYTIDDVETGNCEGGDTIARTLVGTLHAPLYTETDAPGTFLTRDADNLPYANGTSSTPFLVRVPCSVAQAAAPTRILQYGHGLLGSQDEARTGYLAAMANDNHWVIAATDWKGMSEYDVPVISLMAVNNPYDFAFIPERSLQGIVEQMALMKLMIGPLASDEALAFPDDNGDLVNVVDPALRSFYGNSQGAILGSAYVALSPDLDRAVLGVGGMPYSLLLPRSHDFDPFFALFEAKYTDHRNVMFIVTGLLQQLWDMGEGAGYAHDMNAAPPEGMPAKQILLQVAIGDAQVTTLGAHVAARAWGASTVAPQTRPIYGVEERQPPFEGSALVEWDYTDVADEPVVSLPADQDTDPHECPRRNPAGQQQAALFLETGTVDQFCEGVCTDVQATCR